MRSELCGDILIILFWGKVTGIKTYKYTYLLKYFHVVQISWVSAINIYNLIFGTITSLSQTLQKLKLIESSERLATEPNSTKFGSVLVAHNGS